MARIQVYKKFNLSNLGDEWQDCYINFHALTVGDIEKHKDSIFARETTTEEDTVSRLNSLIEILQAKFIDGKVYDSDSKEVVDLTKEDIGQFPIEVLSDAIAFLAPKPQTNS